MKKKTIFFLAVASVLFGANAVSASLWDYYKEQDLKLPTWEERIPTAESCGIPNYEGRADQNIELEKCLEKVFETNTPYLEVIELPIVSGPFDEFLGATPKRPTEYKTSLNEQKTEGHSGTTLKVSTVTTKDGNTLDPAVLGDLIVLSINPGASNSEVVVCTGLTTSTKTFSGCEFGYRFDNPTATSSANIEAHSPGEPVIISNTDTYLSQQYLTLDGNHTVAGANTYSGASTVSGLFTYTNANGLCFVNSSLCLRGSGSNLQWTLDGWTNSYNFTSSSISTLTASSTAGTGILNNSIYILASSTLGMTFGADGRLYQITSSTGNISSNSNGLYLDGTDALTWTGAQTFNANTTFATTTAVSSTITWGTITTSTITSLTLGGENANTLINDSDADSLHTHSYTTLLYSSTTDKGGTISTNDTALTTFNLPANTLSTNNIVEIYLNFEHIAASAGGTAALQLDYGGTTTTLTFITVANQTASGTLKAVLMGAGATNSQEHIISIQEGNAYISDSGTTANGVGSGMWFGSSAIDSTQNQYVSVAISKPSGNDFTFNVKNAYAIVHKL